MSTTELQKLTDQELQTAWNELALFFDRKVWQVERPRAVVNGFFSLSRETERRGLKLDKDNFGKIVLEPIKTNQ